MKISARNKLRGKVAELKVGAVNTVVKIQLTSAPAITAIITNEAAEELGLSEGGDACAVVKASSVMVGICNEGSGCGCQE
jgi:molybdopterin-binding protein